MPAKTTAPTMMIKAMTETHMIDWESITTWISVRLPVPSKAGAYVLVSTMTTPPGAGSCAVLVSAAACRRE